MFQPCRNICKRLQINAAFVHLFANSRMDGYKTERRIVDNINYSQTLFFVNISEAHLQRQLQVCLILCCGIQNLAHLVGMRQNACAVHTGSLLREWAAEVDVTTIETLTNNILQKNVNFFVAAGDNLRHERWTHCRSGRRQIHSVFFSDLAVLHAQKRREKLLHTAKAFRVCVAVHIVGEALQRRKIDVDIVVHSVSPTLLNLLILSGIGDVHFTQNLKHFVLFGYGRRRKYVDNFVGFGGEK